MINPRTGLAAAALAVGAGAVLFLSTNSPQSVDSVPGLGPVPVAPIGMPLPAEPVRVVPAVVPPATTASSALAKPSGQVAPSASKPAGRATLAPAKAASPSRAPRSVQGGVSTRTQQQPRPADTEPNGTGGWQLPACYEEPCVAPMSTHAAPHERTDNGSGLLGDTLDAVMAPVLGLVGGL